VTAANAMTDEGEGRWSRFAAIAGGAEGEARADDGLVRAFLAGDEAAFGELFRRHERAVHAIVRRYAHRPDDGRDLVQRAFLKAFEAARRDLAIHRGRRPVPFRPWLLRIAVNLAKNFARDEARWRRAPLEVVDGAAAAEAPAQPGAEAAMVRAEEQRLMRRAVLDLPRRQREVLTLRLDAELPFAEIAEALGITENNAKVHFHHAARRLRELLARARGETP
jgi:RNA polymerase sigma-70 factor, ECF subfamily